MDSPTRSYASSLQRVPFSPFAVTCWWTLLFQLIYPMHVLILLPSYYYSPFLNSFARSRLISAPICYSMLQTVTRRLQRMACGARIIGSRQSWRGFIQRVYCGMFDTSLGASPSTSPNLSLPLRTKREVFDPGTWTPTHVPAKYCSCVRAHGSSAASQQRPSDEPLMP